MNTEIEVMSDDFFLGDNPEEIANYFDLSETYLSESEEENSDNEEIVRLKNELYSFKKENKRYLLKVAKNVKAKMNKELSVEVSNLNKIIEELKSNQTLLFARLNEKDKQIKNLENQSNEQNQNFKKIQKELSNPSYAIATAPPIANLENDRENCDGTKNSIKKIAIRVSFFVLALLCFYLYFLNQHSSSSSGKDGNPGSSPLIYVDGEYLFLKNSSTSPLQKIQIKGNEGEVAKFFVEDEWIKYSYKEGTSNNLISKKDLQGDSPEFKVDQVNKTISYRRNDLEDWNTIQIQDGKTPQMKWGNQTIWIRSSKENKWLEMIHVKDGNPGPPGKDGNPGLRGTSGYSPEIIVNDEDKSISIKSSKNGTFQKINFGRTSSIIDDEYFNLPKCKMIDLGRGWDPEQDQVKSTIFEDSYENGNIYTDPNTQEKCRFPDYIDSIKDKFRYDERSHNKIYRSQNEFIKDESHQASFEFGYGSWFSASTSKKIETGLSNLKKGDKSVVLSTINFEILQLTLTYQLSKFLKPDLKEEVDNLPLDFSTNENLKKYSDLFSRVPLFFTWKETQGASINSITTFDESVVKDNSYSDETLSLVAEASAFGWNAKYEQNDQVKKATQNSLLISGGSQHTYVNGGQAVNDVDNPLTSITNINNFGPAEYQSFMAGVYNSPAVTEMSVYPLYYAFEGDNRNKIYNYMVYKYGLASEKKDAYESELEKIMSLNNNKLDEIQNDLESNKKNNEEKITNLEKDLIDERLANEKALEDLEKDLIDERRANEKALEDIGTKSADKNSKISKIINIGNQNAYNNIISVIDNMPKIKEFSLNTNCRDGSDVSKFSDKSSSLLCESYELSIITKVQRVHWANDHSASRGAYIMGYKCCKFSLSSNTIENTDVKSKLKKTEEIEEEEE